MDSSLFDTGLPIIQSGILQKKKKKKTKTIGERCSGENLRCLAVEVTFSQL